jgi:Protein of unknown function (Hypoth_ymh)
VEREFGRLKHEWALLPLRVRGLDRVRLHADLTTLLMRAGESQAMMSLFDGAIGVFKNPPSHRQVAYEDPTEASEVVLLADLLLRILDRIARRLKSIPAPS